MEGGFEPRAAVAPPIEILAPAEQRLPLVFASPHSGIDYPAEFLAVSRLDPLTLRRSEDSYVKKLSVADAMARIDRLYRPYHRALRQLVTATQERFGGYLLIDCHSMPSGVLPTERPSRRGRTDIVLGDCHGTSCHPMIMETAHRTLSAKGYSVARNTPYAGGFTTAHYGKPGTGGHCLQIEISRALYMDERNFARKPYLTQLAADMRDLAAVLADLDHALLAAAACAGARRRSPVATRRTTTSR